MIPGIGLPDGPTPIYSASDVAYEAEWERRHDELRDRLVEADVPEWALDRVLDLVTEDERFMDDWP